MGAKVAPDKSYNFSSHAASRKWLEETWWEGIQAHIEVVRDFRYLGAHLTTAANCKSSTMDKRWDKAIQDLKKLRYIPADIQAKVGIIHAKIYAAALYGVEAAEATPAKVAKLTTAVINVFRSRNNNYNVDRFFTTLTGDKNDADPVAQILLRRVLQIRRVACKTEGNEERYK